MLVRSTNDKKLKNYYLKYSKILSKIIRTAKKLYYNNKIMHVHSFIHSFINHVDQDTLM
jgi:uncharacterized protein YbgA (DUF1722 family)